MLDYTGEIFHTSNCHGQNCTRRAIFRLGIDTIIANVPVNFKITAVRYLILEKLKFLSVDCIQTGLRVIQPNLVANSLTGCIEWRLKI